MIEKKYSVLMSVYKKENPEYFRLSIESMINQTLKPDEIVIVKDGHLTNELNEVITSFASVYPKLFTIVSLEDNVGLGKALNEGLKRCRNELVARMDTDDISLKERCELQVDEFIKNKELSIVGTMIDEFYDNPTNIISSRIVPTSHDDIIRYARRRNPFNHPTIMYRKASVLDCGGYSDLRKNQDNDLWVRMLIKGCKTKNIDKSLLLFRFNEETYHKRKNWLNTKLLISVRYKFFKIGFTSLSDFIIVCGIQLLIYTMPIRFERWIYQRFLRKSHEVKVCQ